MSIIIMILLLSFLVLVHEAGHFFAARALGIKVSKFGFGLPIGPTLWRGKAGDVEILVHAFLLGGYVSFPDDEKDVNLPADSNERFLNRPVWQRMIVISAGVIANIVAAFVLVLITAFVWGKLPSGQYEVYINKLSEQNESVLNSGLQPGDRVIKINGSNVPSSYAMLLYSKNSKAYDGKVDEGFGNSNLEKLKKLNPKTGDDVINQGSKVILFTPQDEPAIKIDDEALKGYKLYKDNRVVLNEAQLKLRDELKGQSYYVADGKTALKDIALALSDTKSPLDVAVLRNGQEVQLKTMYANEKGLLGVLIEAKEVLRPTKSIPEALKGTCSYLWEQTYMLVYGLWQLFTGNIPMKDLHGIVAITKIGGDVIQNSGFFSGILLTAMISLDLALVNFLPIPALDGGHFMFLIIEKLRGKPLDEDTINKISSVFFLLLIAFMVFIIFNDIYALVRHKI